MVIDVTERMQAEEALRRTQKMDAIGRLTGGVAHDFNNILSIILGNLDLLELEAVAGDKAYRRIGAIQKAAERAADLTRQLLDFSRGEATKTAVTDVNRAIDGLRRLIVDAVTSAVAVEYALADGLWLTEIDPSDFDNALINLVLNARDAMPGGGRLTLETANHVLDTDYCAQNPGTEPGEYVRLAVSDSGKGISPEVREQIFEPFFTSKPRGEGTGLGLAVVHGFVERSGGHIAVYSEQGIGTTVRLYLPRAAGQAQPVESVREPAAAPPRGRETLLVVDDEAGLVELARASLEGLGYRVVTASNGPEALERLAEEPEIALLCSDVVMPGGINGYELAEQANALRPDLEVLLTSGYVEPGAAVGGRARPGADLLVKPYRQAELARRVRTLLGEGGHGDNGPPPAP